MGCDYDGLTSREVADMVEREQRRTGAANWNNANTTEAHLHHMRKEIVSALTGEAAAVADRIALHYQIACGYRHIHNATLCPTMGCSGKEKPHE